MRLKNLLKMGRHVFTPVIGTQNFDFSRVLSLKMGMKQLEHGKDFTLRMKEINPSESTMIADKIHKVIVLGSRGHKCHTQTSLCISSKG